MLQGWPEDRCCPEMHGSEQPCTFREISEKIAIIPKKQGPGKESRSLIRSMEYRKQRNASVPWRARVGGLAGGHFRSQPLKGRQ